MFVATLTTGDEIQPIESRILVEEFEFGRILNLLKEIPNLDYELTQPYTTLQIHYRKD